MMHCKQVEQLLDEYLDTHTGDQPLPAAAGINQHLLDCQPCQASMQAREATRELLRALPVDGPADGFFSRAVDRAAAAESPTATEANGRARRRADREHSSPAYAAWAGLVAAAFSIVFLATAVMTDPDSTAPAPADGLPAISLHSNEVTPVKLAFTTENALTDARLSLELPVGVELMGHDGKTDLSWNTDLAAGRNVLRLPLIGRTAAATSLLVARLEHPTGSKTFRLQVTVN